MSKNTFTKPCRIYAFHARLILAILISSVNVFSQSGTGLKGEYFNNMNLTAPVALTRTDATVNFDWGSGSPQSGTIGVDLFSVRWTGQVSAPVSGNYTFSTSSDDGIRLWVNDVLVIDNWTDHGPTTNNSSAISLTSGQKYNVKMEFYENGGGAVAKLLWSYPGQGQIAIPQANLYDAATVTYLSDLNWVSAANGYGPVEKDKSNGENGASDGNTITLNSVTYAKGLGVHSTATIIYNLNGAYTRFISDAGIDDEVGNNGSVTFEVYLDNVLAYSSGAVTGASAAANITLNVSGKNELKLVVNDNGDLSYDHADWAGARLESASTSSGPKSKMGVNLVGDMAFANVMDEGLRADGVTSYDAQGWPQSNFNAIFDWRLVAEWFGTIDDPEQFRVHMDGTYQCSFEGQADLSGSGATVQNKTYNSGTNITTFEIVVPATNNGRVFWTLAFNNTKRTSASAVNTGITKIKMMRPGHALGSGKIFNDAYIALCKSASFGCYRYYNVNNVWDGVPAYPTATTWANRKLPTDANQGGMQGINGKSEGWCWEYIIALANNINKDIWINIHISADDNYVTQLATKLQNELNPGINVYVEVGNEVWDPNWHVQDAWLNAQAQALGIEFNQNYARNVVRVSNLFKNVFGASAINNRIRVVLGAQEGWIGRTTDYHLPYIQANFGAPSNYIYALSPATYFGGTGPTIDDAINNCHTDIMKHYDDETDYSSLRQFLKVATDWGFPGKCVSYEGGEHGNIGDAGNLAVEIGKHRTTRMATEYYTQYKSFFDGGATLACQFTIFSAYTRYGNWGLTDDINNADRNYKFKAMRNLTGDSNSMPIPADPAAPTGLSIGAVQGGLVTLNWTDNANNEDGYEVWYKESAGTLWKYLATAGPNKNTIGVGLTVNKTYNFRVRAYNFSKWSAFTNDATASTVEATTTCSDGNGLRATYFNTNNWNFTTSSYAENVANVNFDWGPGTPNPAVTADSFAVKYTGYIKPEFTDTYIFNVQSNWAAHLWINGQQIITGWWGDNLDSSPIALTAGQTYSIELWYQHSYQTWSADAKVKLSWSNSIFSSQVVPQCRLYKPAGFRVGLEETANNVSIYPNPANNLVNVDISSISDDEAKILIINALGQYVQHSKHIIHAGMNNIKLNTTGLSSGVYTISIMKGNEQIKKKISIQE